MVVKWYLTMESFWEMRSILLQGFRVIGVPSSGDFFYWSIEQGALPTLLFTM